MSVEHGTVVSCVHGGVVLVPMCAHTLAGGHSPASSSVTVHLIDFFLIRSLSETGASHFD